MKITLLLGSFYSASCCCGPVHLRKIPTNLSHELIHILTLVVAGYIGMRIPPNTSLNLIIIWTVWRQKVKHDPTLAFHNGLLSDLAGMDDMNHLLVYIDTTL